MWGMRQPVRGASDSVWACVGPGLGCNMVSHVCRAGDDWQHGMAHEVPGWVCDVVS